MSISVQPWFKDSIADTMSHNVRELFLARGCCTPWLSAASIALRSSLEDGGNPQTAVRFTFVHVSCDLELFCVRFTFVHVSCDLELFCVRLTFVLVSCDWNYFVRV